MDANFDNSVLQALERLSSDGSDLARPMEVDFFVDVPSEQSARTVAGRADTRGFKCSVDYDGEGGSWTCCCTKTVVLDLDCVRQIAAELDRLAHDVGGAYDGFGSYGNAPS